MNTSREDLSSYNRNVKATVEKQSGFSQGAKRSWVTRKQRAGLGGRAEKE